MGRVMGKALAVAGLVTALIAFVVFTGAAIVVWKVKEETNRRTDALAGKARAAVDGADRAVAFVREVVDKAEDDLKAARGNAKAEPRTPVNPFVQVSARKASERLVGSVERANAAVVTASDAVEVAKAALQVFGSNEEMKSWFHVGPEQLSQTQSDLGSAQRELENVRTILGVPISEGGQPTPEQLRAVESALGQARGLTDQMGDVVATARKKVAETKQTVDTWVLRVAIGVTAAGVLGALGQIFMARYCWRVLRGKPA